MPSFETIMCNRISAISYSGNREESFNFLKEHHYQPLDLREALLSINRSKKIKNFVKGNWFYLKEEESETPYPKGYYILSKNGNILPFNLYLKKYGRTKDIAEKTIYIYNNEKSLKMPTLLCVNTDKITNSDGVRYVAFSFFSPQNTANLILGKSIHNTNSTNENKHAPEFKILMREMEKLSRKLLLTGEAADPSIEEKLEQINSILKSIRN